MSGWGDALVTRWAGLELGSEAGEQTCRGTKRHLDQGGLGRTRTQTAGPSRRGRTGTPAGTRVTVAGRAPAELPAEPARGGTRLLSDGGKRKGVSPQDGNGKFHC